MIIEGYRKIGEWVLNHMHRVSPRARRRARRICLQLRRGEIPSMEDQNYLRGVAHVAVQPRWEYLISGELEKTMHKARWGYAVERRNRQKSGIQKRTVVRNRGADS